MESQVFYCKCDQELHAHTDHSQWDGTLYGETVDGSDGEKIEFRFEISTTINDTPIILNRYHETNAKQAIKKFQNEGICPACVLEKPKDKPSFLFSASHSENVGYGCSSIEVLFDENLNILGHCLLAVRHTYRSEVYRSFDYGDTFDVQYHESGFRPCYLTANKVELRMRNLLNFAREEVSKSPEFMQFMQDVINKKEEEIKNLRRKFKIV